MKPDEFIWAVRRITGDRPARELLVALRKTLHAYHVGTFLEVAAVQYISCLIDVTRTVREFELHRAEKRRDAVIAQLTSPGMLFSR